MWFSFLRRAVHHTEIHLQQHKAKKRWEPACLLVKKIMFTYFPPVFLQNNFQLGGRKNKVRVRKKVHNVLNAGLLVLSLHCMTCFLNGAASRVLSVWSFSLCDLLLLSMQQQRDSPLLVLYEEHCVCVQATRNLAGILHSKIQWKDCKATISDHFYGDNTKISTVTLRWLTDAKMFPPLTLTIICWGEKRFGIAW